VNVQGYDMFPTVSIINYRSDMLGTGFSAHGAKITKKKVSPAFQG